MIGQGSPKASRAGGARFARAGPWLCAAALVSLALAITSGARAADTTLELRVAWGGGGERVWRGSIRLAQGTIARLQPLGIEADEPGSIWLDHGGIEIHSRSPRAYDGIDLLLTADLDARLLVSLANETEPAPKHVEIPLRDLVYQSHNTTLDATENRLLVSRSPGDRLRVVLARDTLVFSPGDKFQFELGAHLLEPTGAAVRYSAVITANPSGQQVGQRQEYESGDPGTMTSIELRVPEAEGVYDLTITAVQVRGRARLAMKRQIVAERKVQFAVLDKRPQADDSQGPPARVLEINPMNPHWWERLGNLPLVGGLRKGPLGNGESAPWEHPTLGALVQLGPGGTPPHVSWEAYPLPISRPGQAHALEIEYPSDVPQAMGISIIEPNAAGAVMPIGLDSGVYVSDEDAYVASENPATPPKLARHRVVFWPRTKTPLLLLTNRRDGARAVYGKITVSSDAHQQFAMLPLNRAEGGGLLAPAFPRSRPERMWAGYLDHPLFVENFSGPEALDPTSHRCLDDWNTIYQGGLRLTKYLEHVGYTGLMISVLADGSTIYPSRLLEPTPRYDTGVFFSSGQDPVRKDALELLFRMFDRESLTLIPALGFAAPLPELEALRRAGGPEAVGTEWVGADGAPWLATRAPRQGLAPYYNLLHEHVQEAMLRVIREVIARYADHPSFGGVGLQLSPDGYAQLPGDAWGYDDHTIARFERDTKTQVPGVGRERFAARAKFLSGPGRDAWVQWRAAVVADFHYRIEREIASRRPDAKLYLAGGTMLANSQTQARLRPALLKHARLDDALIELGIRAPAYRQHEGIVLLRPQYLKPSSGPLPAQATDWEINLAPEMDKLFAASPQTGSLFYHEPQKARIASFDAKSPFGAANTYAWLVSQMSPSGDRNRRRFVHSLATLDSQAIFDGGWLLSLGQEESLKEILSVYRQLPVGHFDSVAPEFQPTLRTLTRDNQTFVYAVNDSPWDVTVSVNLDLPPSCTMEGLGDSRGIGPLARTANDTNWKLALRPYDLVAARFTAPNVRLRNPVVTIPEHVRVSLERRIKDLSARVGALTNPQPLGALENPSFELPPQGESIPGWTASGGMDGAVSLDPQQKHGGGQSIKLVSQGQPAGIVSAPFKPPTTGRIAVEFWLRTTGGTPPSIRMTIDAPFREGRFDPYGLIPAVGANTNGPGQWVRYSFPVDDLPSEGLGDMSIRLELLSAGEVWVDDMQVFDLSFSETERRELLKLITLASVKLKAGQLADCARLLEGYWPQFLVAYVPLTQTPGPLAQRPRNTEAPATPAKKPTVFENLKGYLPKMPQF